VEDNKFEVSSGNVFADLGFEDPDGELKRARERLERDYRIQEQKKAAAEKRIRLSIALEK
jgi:hypothetical protein